MAVGLLVTFVALASVFGLGLVDWLDLNPGRPGRIAMAGLVCFGLPLPVWMLAGSLFLTPALRVIGRLRYYSPVLIVKGSAKRGLELHGALPFDFLMLFSWKQRGRWAARRIWMWYFEGLIALAREIEAGRFPRQVTITGTSYIFSPRLAQRHGFQVETSPWMAWGGWFTWPTQFLTYSFSQGRWCLPPLRRTARARITGGELCSQIASLQKTVDRLKEGAPSGSFD